MNERRLEETFQKVSIGYVWTEEFLMTFILLFLFVHIVYNNQALILIKGKFNFFLRNCKKNMFFSRHNSLAWLHNAIIH